MECLISLKSQKWVMVLGTVGLIIIYVKLEKLTV